MSTGFRKLSSSTTGIRVAVVIGVAVLGGVAITAFSANSQPTSGRDTGDIRQAIVDAVSIDNTLTMLPNGVRPGNVPSAARQAWRDTVRTELPKHFAGTALTNRMNGLLAWTDRVASDVSEGYVLSFEFKSLSLDEPVIVGDSATVSGTFTITAKQAFDTSGGRTKTYGGTYTTAFTFQMERRGTAWLITDLSEQPVNYVPDPSMDNGDVNPNPDATKSIPKSYEPVPVNPANP